MLGLFLGILLVSGGFYLMTRKQILAIKRESHEPAAAGELIPSSLDLPEQWLAIRSGNVAAVQSLGLSNPRRCTWKMALPSREWNGLYLPAGQRLDPCRWPCPARAGRGCDFVSFPQPHQQTPWACTVLQPEQCPEPPLLGARPHRPH